MIIWLENEKIFGYIPRDSSILLLFTFDFKRE